jgi:hypothetical protein
MAKMATDEPDYQRPLEHTLFFGYDQNEDKSLLSMRRTGLSTVYSIGKRAKQ